MKNKPMYFSFLAVIAFAVAACFLRFFQLIRFTDSQTGFVIGDNSLTYILYGVLVLSVAFAALYSFLARKRIRKINFIGNKGIYASVIALCITYFFDFVHQVYNCFDYIQTADKQAYIEYNYLLPMGLQAIFALLTCFYLIICAKSVKKTAIDFKNFKLFHLVPLAWGFCRLLVIMTEIFDIESVESFLEFVFIVFYCGFTLCCASSIDDENKLIKPSFSFFALGLFALSFSFSFARILMFISGKYEKLSRVSFSAVTYLFVGIFAVICELSVYITEKVSEN